jgi:hypothetical protein
MKNSDEYESLLIIRAYTERDRQWLSALKKFKESFHTWGIVKYNCECIYCIKINNAFKELMKK